MILYPKIREKNYGGIKMGGKKASLFIKIIIGFVLGIVVGVIFREKAVIINIQTYKKGCAF